jgi:hypothetical protein
MNISSKSPLLSGLILFGLIVVSLSGCGLGTGEFSQVGSGGDNLPQASVDLVSDLDLDLDGVVEGALEDTPLPQLGLGAARPPVTVAYSLNLVGSSNANMLPIAFLSPSAQAVFQPLNSAPTLFQSLVPNEPAGGVGATRLFNLKFGLGGTQPLVAGSTLSADSSSAGPRAQLDYGEYNRKSPSVFIFGSTSGQIRLVSLTSTANGSGSATFSFEQVRMDPKLLGSNQAVGSFLVTGQVSYSF